MAHVDRSRLLIRGSPTELEPYLAHTWPFEINFWHFWLYKVTQSCGNEVLEDYEGVRTAFQSEFWYFVQNKILDGVCPVQE